jgi:hypothetical protein
MEDQSIESTATDSVETAVETSTTETLIQSEVSKPEIPSKFLKDGQPDYDAMTKAYVALESKLGSKVPVSDSTEYDFAFQNPDSWNQDEFAAFKDQAVQLGLSKEQFNSAMSLYEQNMNAVLDQYAPSAEKAQSTLQTNWGDQYDANMKSAAKAIETFYPDAFNDPELGSNAKFIQVMSKIGQQLKEDSAPSAVNTGKGTGVSKLEIEALMARPDYLTNQEVQKTVTAWYEANYR